MTTEPTTSPTSAPALWQAQNPRATADELLMLSYTHDQDVLASVAVHPNAPAPLLARLAVQFPAEVLGNPALPLLRLAQPQLLSGWPPEALLALLNLPETPAWLRGQAMRSPHAQVQVALASLPGLTRAEVANLARHPAWLVRARIAGRPDLPEVVLHGLLDDKAYGVRLALASRPDLPERGIQHLRRDSSRFVRQTLQQTFQGHGEH